MLFNESSRRMARNLQLPKPAHESKVCLDCHADNVEAGQRGEKLHLEDGVGCEACHGGAARWLGPHATGTTHQANLALGMYPTDDPVARAELCLSCHLGNGSKFVNHRLMGAGHPRQSFELHVFGQIQPAHFRVDTDYRQRGKQAPESVKVWAIGQAVTVRELLGALLDPGRARDGIWPEFVLFDCHACHHPMSQAKWRPRPSVGLPPGLARLNDSSFLMLRHVAAAVAPDTAPALQRGIRALHDATSLGAGDGERIAAQLREQVVELIPKLAAWQVNSREVRAIATSLIDEGARGEYVDYAAAEQAVMALQILVDSLYSLRALNDVELSKLRLEIDALLTATRDPERYQPGSVPPILGRIRVVIGASAS